MSTEGLIDAIDAMSAVLSIRMREPIDTMVMSPVVLGKLRKAFKARIIRGNSNQRRRLRKINAHRAEIRAQNPLFPRAHDCGAPR